MTKNITLVFSILLFHIVFFAQSQNEFIRQGDSCMNIYEREKAIDFYKKGIAKNATAINYFKLCKAYDPLKRKEYVEAKNILKKLLTTKIEDPLLEAKINLELGETYRLNYQYDSAKIYMEKSLALSKNLKYYEPLQKIARFYISEGDFNKALKYALLTEKSAMSSQDKDLLARAYIDLGSIYLSLETGSPKGMSYLNLALKTKGKSNTTIIKLYESLSNHTANIGIAKGDREIYSKAIPYMQKAYQYSRMIKDSIGMADNILSLASYHVGLGELDKARKKFKEAASVLLPSDSPQNIGRYYLYYGDFLRVTEIDIKKGLWYMSKAAKIWETSGSKYNRSRVLVKISEGYADLGDYKLAYKFQKEYQTLDKELTGEKTRKQIAELNIKYETEKKDAQLAQQKVQLLEKQQRIIQIALSAALVLLVLIALFAYYRHQQQQKIKAMESEFEQTTQQLESFNYSVSHDLRHPLINAQHALEELEQDIKSNNRQLSLVNKTQHYIANMHEIIDTMLLLASIERNNLQLTEIDSKELVNDVIEELQIDKSNRVHVGELPTIRADARLLRQVFVNLLSNAVKYSSMKDNPKIEVLGEAKNGKIDFIVRDNGIGFDERFSNKLFQLFGRLHADINGIGVGLVVVKKIIEKHGGSVWATAKQNQGAKFIFQLPY